MNERRMAKSSCLDSVGGKAMRAAVCENGAVRRTSAAERVCVKRRAAFQKRKDMATHTSVNLCTLARASVYPHAHAHTHTHTCVHSHPAALPPFSKQNNCSAT